MYYAFTLMDYPIIRISAGKDKLEHRWQNQLTNWSLSRIY